MITGQQLLVKTDSDVKGIADLKGKKVCSAPGSTSLENVEAEGAKPVPARHLLRVRGRGAQRHRRRRCRPTARSCSVSPRRTRASSRSSATSSPRSASASATPRSQPGDVRVDQRDAAEGLRRRQLGEGVRGDARAARASRRPSRRRWTPARPEQVPDRDGRGGPRRPPRTPPDERRRAWTIVLDNLDLVARAFAYTVLLFVVLRRALADRRHDPGRHAGRPGGRAARCRRDVRRPSCATPRCSSSCCSSASRPPRSASPST